MADPTLLALNFSAGVLAFFSPCGFPMLPAYVAYYLPRGAEGERVPVARAFLRGVGGGALASLGALLVLAVVGALAVTLGSAFKQRVNWLELAGGLLVLGLGVAVLLGRGPSFKVPISPARTHSAWGLVGFGALYAAVAAGCVAPVFIGVVLSALAAPTGFEAALLIGAYALGLTLLLLTLTVLVATAQQTAVRAMKRVLPYTEKVSGVLLILVGLYLLWYWAAVEYGIAGPPTLRIG